MAPMDITTHRQCTPSSAVGYMAVLSFARGLAVYTHRVLFGPFPPPFDTPVIYKLL